MKNIKFLLLSFFILFIFVGAGCQSAKEDENGEGDKDRAIEEAYNIFNDRVAEGVDMRDGPCISEKIEVDPPLSGWWVVDVAHNPRISEDNNPENQCESYRKGDAEHFVELDVNGNLIKAK